MKHDRPVELVHIIEIARPAEDVFDALMDVEKQPLWMDGLQKTVYLSEWNEDQPVGIRFQQTIQKGPLVADFRGKVTHYEKPSHVGILMGDQRMSIQIDYHLRGMGESTRLEYTAKLMRTGQIALMSKRIFERFTKRAVERQLPKLKELLETPGSGLA